MGPAPAEKFFNFKQPPGPLAWFAGLKGSESVFFIKEFLDSVAFRDFFWFVSIAGFRAIWSASVCTSMHMCACVWAFRVCVCVCMCMCMPTGEENVVFCMGFGSSWLFVLLSIRGDCGFSYGLGFGFVFRVWQWEWWWSSSSSSSSSPRRLVVVASSSSSSSSSTAFPYRNVSNSFVQNAAIFTSPCKKSVTIVKKNINKMAKGG